jgi:hypothetical protein
MMFSQLAPTPLYPDECVASLHLPLLPVHLFPQPTVLLLLVPPPHSLPDILQLVRPMFSRPQ